MQKEHPRIVSLVPSWTETLFTFGLDTEVVGVTRWCVHPKEIVERIEKVGGTKDPDVARIVALAPDLVVCEKEENRKEDVRALEDAGVRVFLSEIRSVEDSLREIRRLGDVLGRAEAARSLVERIQATIAEVEPGRASPPIPAYVPIWRSPWMTLTRETYAHHVLALAGAHNVFGADEGRYPERGPEEAIEAGARVALLPTEPYPFHTKEKLAREELVDAGFPPERIAIIDGEALTWYGARAVDGIRAIASAVRAVAGPM